ncbi:MAG: helix-turn-helix domain-containing protein [Hungatella sp.]|nr:helix-turn-helix domain-containing protein [Hungatella sp.]
MINFRLKNLLDEKGYTQLDLVRNTGIRQPTISAISNNSIKELSVSNLDKICDFLDCEPGDLIEKIPPQNLDKRRMLISRDYSMPITTKEERIKMVNDALALSTLDAPEPTRFTKQLTDQFIDGKISEEDMLKMTLERYQM